MWWKFIFPAIWISGFGAGTAALWLGAFHGLKGILTRTHNDHHANTCPEASPFYAMFTAAGLVAGIGFTRIYRRDQAA